ncbi:flagellar hook-associated protein FlgL [Endozoicomonas lisbonensis]|uniref:Flagellar hook-associated protein 3 FlgL n=1 Tax=Endozoicomonas lisbonensis TaxID=3120522 RepID=A0ABV2SBK1_9GAMM
MMRVSTMQMNNTMTNNMMSTSSSMNRILMELSTGKKILKPSDDTLASTQILGLEDANEALGSYEKNMMAAQSSLVLAETVVSDMVDVLNRMRDLTLGTGGIPTPYDEEGGNSAQAQEIAMLVETLEGLANTRSSSGEYIFGGTMGDSPPVGSDDDGTYSVGGSDSSRQIKISDSQTVDLGVVAGDLFVLQDGSNIFDVMNDFVDALNDPSLSQDEMDQITADTLDAIDETLDNMNQALTHIGGTLNTIDQAMASNMDMQMYNENMINSLEAVDFASAITDFTMMQAQYAASQKAYAMVGSASLFDYV